MKVNAQYQQPMKRSYYIASTSGDIGLLGKLRAFKLDHQ